MKALLLALLAILCASDAVAKPRDWQPATVAAITSSTSNNGAAVIPLNGALYGVYLRRVTVWYRMETDGMVYVLAWTGKRHPLNVTLHAQTKIAIDGQNAHILDDSGKDVKLPIAEKIAKP